MSFQFVDRAIYSWQIYLSKKATGVIKSRFLNYKQRKISIHENLQIHPLLKGEGEVEQGSGTI